MPWRGLRDRMRSHRGCRQATIPSEGRDRRQRGSVFLEWQRGGVWRTWQGSLLECDFDAYDVDVGLNAQVSAQRNKDLLGERAAEPSIQPAIATRPDSFARESSP